MFEIRGITKIGIAVFAAAVFLWRAVAMISAVRTGDETALLAFPFTVIFPMLLIAALWIMGPTKTREGLLMRFGTLLHLLLIISLPQFALYLALGFPFVFLAVEVFETKLPKSLSNPLSKIVLA